MRHSSTVGSMPHNDNIVILLKHFLKKHKVYKDFMDFVKVKNNITRFVFEQEIHNGEPDGEPPQDDEWIHNLIREACCPYLGDKEIDVETLTTEWIQFYTHSVAVR